MALGQPRKKGFRRSTRVFSILWFRGGLPFSLFVCYPRQAPTRRQRYWRVTVRSDVAANNTTAYQMTECKCCVQRGNALGSISNWNKNYFHDKSPVTVFLLLLRHCGAAVEEMQLNAGLPLRAYWTYKTRRFDCQHRTIYLVQYAFRGIAHEESGNARSCDGSHNDEVDI